MRRFLMLLAMAAIAATMYVAAAPGSALHAGPTWRQYVALKKQLAATRKVLGEVVVVTVNDHTQLGQVATAVTSDETELGQVATTAANSDQFIKNCLLTPSAGVAPTTERGDLMASSYGFAFYNAPPGPAPSFYTGALQFDFSAHPQSYFQRVDPNCVGNGTEHVGVSP